MKDIKYIRDYYNKHYTDKLQSLFEKTLILQAFKPYENDKRQGKWLSKQMDIKGDEKILECGCGIGGVMKQIASLYPNTEIDGINVSDKQIEMGKEVLKDFDNCNLSVQDYKDTDYKDSTFDIVYFCESICYSDYKKAIKEAHRILKPNGTLYIKDLVTKCSKDKLSESELTKLNTFTDSWYTEVFDTETIIDIVDNIGGFELISNKRFIKPSIHWINAVRNSSLKQYHNAKTSSIPPIRGVDFLYKKI